MARVERSLVKSRTSVSAAWQNNQQNSAGADVSAPTQTQHRCDTTQNWYWWLPSHACSPNSLAIMLRSKASPPSLRHQLSTIACGIVTTTKNVF
uniref:Uncharacterized protein n=1 Tax=Haemonchus contortus TaxID=6289 RepID=A0A7I4XRH0_HAECO|nr:unnamed protein product [Haemonchus contortus]